MECSTPPLRSQNSVERCRADKIVISAPFEKQNYMTNYHYPEDNLIPTGMARYDHIDRSKRQRTGFSSPRRDANTLTQEINSLEVGADRLKAQKLRLFQEFLTLSRERRAA